MLRFFEKSFENFFFDCSAKISLKGQFVYFLVSLMDPMHEVYIFEISGEQFDKICF
jgi:hypothetical protein